jgi:hypothetical protein
VRPYLLKRKELKKARKEKLQRKEEERVGKRIPRNASPDDDSSDNDGDGDGDGFAMEEEERAGKKRKKEADPFAGWDELEFEGMKIVLSFSGFSLSRSRQEEEIEEAQEVTRGLESRA